MSVQSEITRLASAKNDIATAITNKGVTVPSGTKLDGMAALIDQIKSGGNGGKGIRINVYNYTHEQIYIESSKGQSGGLNPSGGSFNFDNLSNGSSLTISDVFYDNPIFYFIDHGCIANDAFPNESYRIEIMDAADQFIRDTMGSICDSNGFQSPGAVEICFDPDTGSPVIIIA